jgi:hypothetical protein
LQVDTGNMGRKKVKGGQLPTRLIWVWAPKKRDA